MAKVVRNSSGYHSRGRDGVEKAQQFGAYCKEHGWSGDYKLEDGVVHLIARRGENEVIEIWWSEAGKALPRPDLPVYTLAGESVKLLNVSAAAVRVANEPEHTRLREAVRKRRKRAGGPVAPVNSTRFKDMPDDEIEHTLLGKRITWINSISGDVDSAEVLGRKTIKVYRNGRDQVHFTDEAGFHAVYLDAIVSVR